MSETPVVPVANDGTTLAMQRQSVVRVRSERPPRKTIERLLEAAVLAPNHHLNQPWKFVVLAGAAREAFGELPAQRVRRQLAGTGRGTVDVSAATEAERRKPLRAPVVVIVAALKSEHPGPLPLRTCAQPPPPPPHRRSC